MNKDKILIQLAGSGKAKLLDEEFSKQSFPQQVFSAIWWLEAEVNNGGFWQYFANSSSQSAWFVEIALETIGAAKTADICRRAIAVAFPDGLPGTVLDIEEATERFSEETARKLHLLNQEFYQYPNDLVELLFAFVMRHPEEFGELPTPDES